MRLAIVRGLLLSAGTTLMAILTGCGAGSSVATVSGVSLTGHVQGGQQPVNGASIKLYAAGAGGNGVGAVNLLGTNVVTTDSRGGFSLNGDYFCPTAATQVYLVSQGGNPGLSGTQTNSALTMVAALGNCGDLSSSTFIYVDEVTTAAAAWALARFAGTGAVIGSTATNTTGLANAFAIAKNLADTKMGSAPGALPPGASTEVRKLNTLADVLAACVNSDGTAACQPLFSAATVNGMAPANTFDAAVNIVRNPAANVATVWGLSTANAPFQPVLSAAPNDWTMSIVYGNCTSGCGGLNLPGGLGVDASGDVWVANYFGAVVSEFSPAGVALAPNGFVGTGLRESYGLSIDGTGFVWVTNYNSVTGAANSGQGSVSKFSSAGAEQSGYGYTAGGVYYPIAIAADSNGTVWVADHSNSSATLLANDGSAISTSNGYAKSQIPFVSAVALDGLHNAWFAAQHTVASVTAAGTTLVYSCGNGPAGIAVDPSGNVWVADYNGSAMYELSSAGTQRAKTILNGGNLGPEAVAIDGNGMVWAANYYGNSVSELSGSTAAVLSPVAGYGLDTTLASPYGMAIDASGNVWVSNSGNNTITSFVGLAEPVKTPVLGPPSKP